MLSFTSMITTGIFAIPLITDFFLNNEIDWSTKWTNGLFSITSLLGCIWGIMAHNQFEYTTKLIRETWYLCRKLDPTIGNYRYNPPHNLENNKEEDGYQYQGLVDFWDIENEVPEWMDKGKYWKILLEFRKINKNVVLKVTRDQNLPFDDGKKNVVLTIKEDSYFDNIEKNLKKVSRKNKVKKFKILIPQWLVINTEYKRYNTFSQTEIDVITEIISDINKNITIIIDEIIFREKTILKYPWNIVTIFLLTYMNKSLPIRIIYNKIKETLPGAKKRHIQNTNENLSRISIEYLIDSILSKAKTVGIKQQSLDKLYSLIRFIKNEYDKLGLGEGSSEYHNLHHSLEVAYMSISMLPKEIHGYNISPKDYETMLVAALLHDYDPLQGIKQDIQKFSRIPTVTNTISTIKRKKIHEAYFSLNNEELIKFFRKNEPTFLPSKDFATTHPEQLKGRDIKIESKIVEALIWRTDYPFDRNAYDNFNLLLKEIDSNELFIEKINIIAEILSLADLSVTYLSSDPLLAWDRVLKLYDELDFPTVEAVYRTDRFLSLFSEGSLFKEIISGKNFPEVFRQKWDNVYQFFHEGNPSNRINKIIIDAKAKYQKVNIDLEMTFCDYLINNALQNTNEFFIGIGKTKEEIMIAQEKLSGIQLENLEVIPGNVDNILPFLKFKSIDNFVITLINEDVESFISKIHVLRKLLHLNNLKTEYYGTIQIIIDKKTNVQEIMTVIDEHKFRMIDMSNEIDFKMLGTTKTKYNDKQLTIKVITIKNSKNTER